jgi:hypothetical protein
MRQLDDSEFDVGNFRCKDCKHFSFVLPQGECKEGGCQKRIDHNRVEFACPWFKCAPEECGLPCSDFEPSSIHVDDIKHWTGWKDYWKKFVKTWLPYQNEDILVYFVVNGDNSIRYGVPLKKYLYGTMFDGNKMLATEKMYYKKHNVTKERTFPYELVREVIEGV